MMNSEHDYESHLIWDGNRGDGTSKYETYGRDYRILIDGKPDLQGSSDQVFRGDPRKHNPEDWFVAAVSSCHMLSYLALCARSRITVIAYEDHARGVMKEDGRGGGKFEEVVLRPVVTIADTSQTERAMKLQHKAHELCYIANSCSVPIRVIAEVRS